jgi:multidrug efflux pump
VWWRPVLHPVPRFGFLQDLAARELPPGYSIDYDGLSRQYVQESSGFLLTFGFAW